MALTRLPSFTILSTDSYTFGNANVSGNVTTGNLKTDHLLYSNGSPYVFTSNAAGANTQVQFNDGNSFAASANFTFDKTTNTLTVTNYAGNGSGLTSIAGANVTGVVGNATHANVSDSANSVAVANVTGIGNIATINKDGNASNILYGNGVFAGAPVTYSDSNVAAYLPTYTGNLSPGNITIATGHLHLTGGNSGQFLQTDGTGNITWVDNLPITVEHVANSITLTGGVYVSGTLADIQTFGDYGAGNAYVLTDGTGSAPAWYLDIDFINVDDFNRVVMNINYTQSSGHTIYVQLYNTQTSAWDSIGTYTGLGSYYAFALQVIDGSFYNNSGRVQLRLYHSNSGNSAHTTSIDYVGLELSNQGPQGPKGLTGATGNAGPGVASGGMSGQYLIKNSATNYDTAWVTPTGTTITVDNFTANGVQTDFSLSVTPESEAFTMVAMAGTLQPRSVYTVTGNVLSFSSAPPNTAPIEVTIFSSVMGYGTTDFLANSISANTITTTTVTGNVNATTITANTLSGNIVSSNSNLSVNTLSANSITNTGTGIPTINSATSINFTASTVVRTTSSPFQFYNCTSTVRDAIAASNGYVIYNTTTNKLQVYANGTWVDLH